MDLTSTTPISMLTLVNSSQCLHGLDANRPQVAKDGSIFSFGGSFYEGEIPAPSELRKRDLIQPVEALRSAVTVLQLPVEADKATAEPAEGDDSYVLKGTSGAEKDPKAQLMYLQQDGQLKLTFRVETDILSNWLLTYVDAATKDEVHAVVDWAADASYQV
jgi:extracellular elastinolytic metalloproteinase